MVKKTISLCLFLFSLTAFSQNSAEQSAIQNPTGMITLQKLVEKIKSETESLKEVKTINVMVNDLLIEDLETFMIDPKNIRTKEILILEKGASHGGIKASIIINTKKK